DLLKDLDLKAEAASLRETIRTSKGQKQQRAIKRLKVVNAFITSENRPEWIILEAVPVIPPELRPMVQLDGGRFATSDLNDLYRLVINRNNRLKRLLDLGALEIIVNNWKRMLEEVIAEHPVLLNRAPTLHRLGIQAFEPVLVEGKAIQVHPLVCHAFNADFDGDQMAVHLPLSAEAQAEARILMLSSNNILSPASGRPLATPTKDMVLGTYFLTYCPEDLSGVAAEDLDPRPSRFQSEEEVEFAIDAEQVTLQQPIEYRRGDEIILTTAGRVIFNAEVERALEEVVWEDEELDHDFINRTLPKREIDAFIGQLVDRYGAHAIANVLDKIKSLGFHYATQAGVTISKNDIVIPPEKEQILAEYENRVAAKEGEYERGLITEEERHEAIVEIWTEATDTVADAMQRTFFELNPIYMMANSGARGSSKQIRQLAGMRGLMANPKGEIIERPIKANFMEGLSVLEYFISTHGARKGLADTALRTADSGYLTRRLVDVSQDVIIRDEDCKTKEFVELPILVPEGVNKSLFGRLLAVEVHKPLASGKPGKTVVAEKGEELTAPILDEIIEALGETVDQVKLPVRSVLKCKSEFGVCRACYGTFLATGETAEIGDAVGIIAAQSIGEPGTQLTMRTFHTGGVAGADITHGLPRGVEIHDKHIELIVRQMLKKVRVENAGDTDLLPGQLVDKTVLDRENARVKKDKKEQATFEPLILGITKASLATESFLSAASFQETTKVLTDASIEGKVDRLLGLKENVIIGKLIPAATGLKRYRTIEIAPSDTATLPGRARADGECSPLPAKKPVWIDFADGSVPFWDEFARPGVVAAASNLIFPPKLRAAGAQTVYWDMYLNNRVGTPAKPADPETVVARANKLFDVAVQASGCSTPPIAENELFGASLVTPWAVTNA